MHKIVLKGWENCYRIGGCFMKRIVCFLWVFICLFACASGAMEEKINATLGHMTFQERAAMLNGVVDKTGAGQNSGLGEQTKAYPNLGLSYMSVSDGPMGVNLLGTKCTSFGSGLIMSATWNPALIGQVGDVIGEEARYKDVQIFLGPAFNIIRDLTGGRTFEYFSEDPYLSGAIATEYVKGVQGNSVGVTVKHYLANNQEWNRNFVSSNMSERAMHELYLPAFKMAVTEGDAWGVMTGANRQNGVFPSDNRYLLTNILKNDYGMRGIVMTDWCSVRSDVYSMKSGVDIAMPGAVSSMFYTTKVQNMITSGAVAPKVLDEKVQRILRVAYLTKSMQRNSYVDNTGYTTDNRPAGSMNTTAHQNVAKALAEEGVVLLKNENNLLPLNKSGVRSIAVLGKHVSYTFYGKHGGSGVTNPYYQRTYLQGLQNRLGSAVALNCPTYDESNPTTTINAAVAAARACDVAIIYGGLNSTATTDPNVADTEDGDRNNIDFPPFQLQLIKAVAAANPKTIVVLNGSVMEVRDFIDSVPAVLHAFYPGQEYGYAVTDILFGTVNPSGKLPFTWPKRYEDTCGYLPSAGENQKDGKFNDVFYKEGIYVGYKWNDKKDIEPEFAFGHGLSYTTFAFSDLKLNKNTMMPGETATLSVKVTNTGSRQGKEVVQLYIGDKVASVSRPEKELKGFQKIDLAAGASRIVTFTIDDSMLSFWDVDTHSFKAEAGEFVLWVGNASDKLPLSCTLTLSEDTLPDASYTVVQAEDYTELSEGKVVGVFETDSEIMETSETQTVAFSADDSRASWRVNVEEAGKYSVIFRYANANFNGSSIVPGEPCPCMLSVAGTTVGVLDFQNTRHENVFNYDSVDVNLSAGENFLTLSSCATGENLYIDKIIVQKIEARYPEPISCDVPFGEILPSTQTADGVLYEAEDTSGASSVPIPCQLPGYTGVGYYPLRPGEMGSWTVSSSTFSSDFRIRVRYLNESDMTASCAVYIDSVRCATLQLPPTGSATAPGWAEVMSDAVTLKTGVNLIALAAEKTQVYVDSITVTGGMGYERTQPPKVLRTSPKVGKAIFPEEDILLFFDEPVTLTDTPITVTDETGTPVAAEITAGSGRLRVSLKNKASEYWTIHLPKGAVLDDFGNQNEEQAYIFYAQKERNYSPAYSAISYSGAYTKGSDGVVLSSGGSMSFWADSTWLTLAGRAETDGVFSVTVNRIEKNTYTFTKNSDPLLQLLSTGTGLQYWEISVTSGKVFVSEIILHGDIHTQKSISGVTATSFATGAGAAGAQEGPQAALDGNLTTRWAANAEQAPGQWFQLDLGKTVQLGKLVLEEHTTDYPRGYRAYVSQNALDWTCVDEGVGKVDMTAIDLKNQSFRYVRLEQTQTVNNWWGIHEIYFFEAISDATDACAPSVPTFLSAEGGNRFVSLSWQAAGDNVKIENYIIYRDGVRVAETSATDWCDTNAVNGMRYTYRVAAKDASGNTSALSEEVIGVAGGGEVYDRKAWSAAAFHQVATAHLTWDTPLVVIHQTPERRWTTGNVQSGGEWFVVDFGRSIAFDVFTMSSFDTTDYPNRFSLYLTDDFYNRDTPIYTGAGMQNTMVEFSDVQSGRFLFIEQTGTNRSAWWSVYDVNVYKKDIAPLKIDRGTPLPKADWVGSAYTGAAAALVDGDRSGGWINNEIQSGFDQWIQVDMEKSTAIDEVVLYTPESAGTAGFAYRLEVSENGEDWKPVAVALGAYQDETVLTLPKTETVQYFRVYQTATVARSRWAVYEVEAYTFNDNVSGMRISGEYLTDVPKNATKAMIENVLSAENGTVSIMSNSVALTGDTLCVYDENGALSAQYTLQVAGDEILRQDALLIAAREEGEECVVTLYPKNAQAEVYAIYAAYDADGRLIAAKTCTSDTAQSFRLPGGAKEQLFFFKTSVLSPEDLPVKIK